MDQTTKKPNITLLGCGRWGSFIAWYLNKNGFKVTVWGRKGDPLVDALFASRVNEYVAFPKTIKLTNDLEAAVNENDIIIISISAQAVRDLMQNVQKIKGFQNKNYCLCMKGIEDKTGKRLSEVLIEHGVHASHIAAWVGPGHIQEFTKGVPSMMVIDSYNPALSGKLVRLFRSDLIRFYQGMDMIGTEIGAAAKNVMGVAAGMLDGAHYEVLKGALMARGTREIAKLMRAEGGKEISAYGLCHLGDYEATLFSKHSHNRGFGENFIQGKAFGKLAEGVATSSALLKMAKKHKLDMPVTRAVYDIINGKKAADVLKELFSRTNLVEFD